MLTKKLLPVFFTFISVFAVSAKEKDLSYSYVDIAYQRGDFLNADFDGIRIGMSKAITGSVFIIGSYAIDEFEDPDLELDFKTFDIGLGFNLPLYKKIHFVASAEYVNYDVEISDEDDDGYRINAGIRAKPNEFFELSAFTHYADIEDEDNTGLSVEARYFFTPVASVGLIYSKDHDADELDIITFNARLDY